MRQRNRGIYIISALIITVMVVMFVGSGLLIGRGGTFAARQSQDDLDAEMAAQAGLQYCVARITENPAWKGDGNGVIVNSPGLVVEEDEGNIVGLLTENGRVSQFRVRFNFQDDGAGDAEGLPDPTLWVDHPYVSVNNLAFSADAPLPRADGANHEVLASSPRPDSIPANSVGLLVEGRAGAGLRDHTSTDINAAPNGPVQTRVVEATYVLSAIPGADAAAQAGADLQARLQNAGDDLQVRVARDGDTPRVRSKGAVSVREHGGTNQADYVTDDGEIYSASGTLDGNLVGTANQFTEGSSDSFLQLTWSDIKKADPAGNSITAGTYVFWDNGTLHYYDMDYANYKTHIQTNPTDAGAVVDPASLPSGFELDAANGKITIREDIFVGTSGGGVDELNIIPRKGAQEEPEASGGSYPLLPAQVPASNALAADYYVNVLGDFNDNGPFHQMLLRIADSGSYSHPGGHTIVWNATQMIDLNNNTQTAIHHMFGPGAQDNFTATNPDLSLVTDNGDGTFRLNTTAFNDWVTGGAGGTPSGTIDLPTVTDTLTPKDLEVHFEPADGESATLSASGDVLIGAGVFGEGGSITATGNIKIVGARTDLAANPNGVEGVNLYAVGDIELFALAVDPNSPGDFVYEDFSLKGIVYTQGNFRAHLGQDSTVVNRWGNLNIEGTLVAYGGDPASDDPGVNGGVVEITASGAELVYNPAYLGSLLQTIPPTPVTKIYFSKL